MMRALVLLLLAAACGRPDRTVADGAAATPDSASAAEGAAPMPAFPEAARGRLAAQSAGPSGTPELRGEWPAEAGTCDQPPMLQLVAQEPGMGTIVLLALPAESRVTRYPIAIVTGGLPTPPAAQVGVNLFRALGTYAFQAADGEVEVYALERVVSGRFAVTLREINTNVRVRYAGTFREVPVKSLDAAQCALADSVAAR
jgi:hypothetical protein